MSRSSQHRPWFEDAVFYGLDVATFMDSDGDGIGDFQGLRSRLDYLASLGVTCLWLLPFYPTPRRDNGYDVEEYQGVDPRLGSLEDFAVFMDDARRRGFRVIIDLVVHHTSDQHPWFQQARADKESPYRDYYVWTDEPPAETRATVVFPGAESSPWEYDERAGAYYLHEFYRFQPDLNITYPKVREEISRITEFWQRFGVSGFRIDAASHMFGGEALKPNAERQPHEFLRFLRRTVNSTDADQDAVLIAEADVDASKLGDFFGDGDEMHLLFNFLLDNFLFLALARQEAEPIARALDLLPPTPIDGGWVNFARNLDELDLERLSERERQQVYATFAPEESMRIYNRGIRRRLAPMLEGNRRRIELVYSLLFSLPGRPLIVYGDEIGMGDDLSLPDRQSVRTPMQWSTEANGGFSTAERDQLILPVIGQGDYRYQAVNVAAQQNDPDSLLSWMKRLIHMRRQIPEIVSGRYAVIPTNQPGVLAHRYDGADCTLIALHNLTQADVCVELQESDPDSGPIVETFSDRAYPSVDKNLQQVSLSGYGYRWFRTHA